MLKEIVVGTDGSDLALKAARVAGEIARKFQANLTLLSVFDLSNMVAPYEGGPDTVPYMETMLQMGEEMQDNVQRRTGEVLKELEVPFHVRRETGHPVETIVRVAEEQKADLIVLGSRGLGTFKRLRLGSVSDGVLHHAHCPVLIVR